MTERAQQVSTQLEGRAWWGEARASTGSVLRWRVGPTTLWVQRLAAEWRLAHTTSDDPLEAAVEVATQATVEELARADESWRYVDGSDGDAVHLAPALADRSVVTRPQTPFHILAGDTADIYVSSPVWIRVETLRPNRPLADIPSFRPSDTWQGPSTLEGELCYATRTACRLELGDVPLRPHRAVTHVRVRNATSSSFLLERLCVPVPQLQLFAGNDDRLWTPTIELRREDEEDQGLAALSVESGPPREAGGTRTAFAARQAVRRNGLIRAFSSLF